MDVCNSNNEESSLTFDDIGKAAMDSFRREGENILKLNKIN